MVLPSSNEKLHINTRSITNKIRGWQAMFKTSEHVGVRKPMKKQRCDNTLALASGWRVDAA
jgi:hypothetical protein